MQILFSINANNKDATTLFNMKNSKKQGKLECIYKVLIPFIKWFHRFLLLVFYWSLTYFSEIYFSGTRFHFHFSCILNMRAQKYMRMQKFQWFITLKLVGVNMMIQKMLFLIRKLLTALRVDSKLMEWLTLFLSLVGTDWWFLICLESFCRSQFLFVDESSFVKNLKIRSQESSLYFLSYLDTLEYVKDAPPRCN